MIIDNEIRGESLEEEIKIEIFKEVRLVVPFYGSFDEDSVCHTVEQTEESRELERTIKKVCRNMKNEDIRICVLGEINPRSIWQKSKPNRHLNSLKIWWKSVKYGLKEYPAFVVIYKDRIKKKKGVPTQEEIETMIKNIQIEG
jgi:hypothetical protein